MTVRFGVDVFLDQVDDYRHQRLALVTNQAATTAGYIPARLALLNASYLLVKLFSLFIKLVFDYHPARFAWAYPTHANPTGKNHLDKLLGIPKAEALFDHPLACSQKRLFMQPAI